jgi:hypothetical protein
VIIDAVSLKPEERQSFVAAAKAASVLFSGLWLAAPASTMETRLRARRHDASDASPEVLAQQLQQDAGPIDWVIIDEGSGPDPPGRCSTRPRLGLNSSPLSDRRRFSAPLLCLDLLRELDALLRAELLYPRSLAPRPGRADRPRRLLVLCSTLLQSTITGHSYLLWQPLNLGLLRVGAI